jgi:hypothetical protein
MFSSLVLERTTKAHTLEHGIPALYKAFQRLGKVVDI